MCCNSLPLVAEEIQISEKDQQAEKSRETKRRDRIGVPIGIQKLVEHSKQKKR